MWRVAESDLQAFINGQRVTDKAVKNLSITGKTAAEVAEELRQSMERKGG